MDKLGLFKLELPLDISTEMVSKEGASETDACITLASKSIIKVDSLDWKQIMEFRRDREAREKLRRFRLFAYANYVGKPKAYVEDGILQRLDEYETTVKQWGFETLDGASNILVSSKWLIGTAGAFISTLFGAPSAVLLAGAPGAAIELSRLGIYLSKQCFTLRKTLKEILFHIFLTQKRNWDQPEGLVTQPTSETKQISCSKRPRIPRAQFPQQHDCQHCTDPSGHSFSQLSGCSLQISCNCSAKCSSVRIISSGSAP
jgi:hypothetical protein